MKNVDEKVPVPASRPIIGSTAAVSDNAERLKLKRRAGELEAAICLAIALIDAGIPYDGRLKELLENIFSNS